MFFYDVIKKFIIFSIFVSIVSTDSSICGNWTQYKGEKCVLILDENKLLNYDDSVKTCSQTENSVLLTINSKEEQEFISEFLFKTHKIVDNIWIGLKKTQNSYQWIDNSDSHYTNWANGSPTNITDSDCVQISGDNNQIGKWVDATCIRKNIVVCQKTISDLFKTINELRKELNETKNNLTEKNNQLIKELTETKTQLYLCKNPIINTFNYSKTFTDENGKHKVFIIPMNEKGGYNHMTFNESVNYCSKFNSTLVEIQSQQKQSIFESFMRDIGLPDLFIRNTIFGSFWINGRRDSSGKFIWINSTNEFSYTNWGSSEPNNYSGYDYVMVLLGNNEVFGKWYTGSIPTYSAYVICELEIN